MSRAVYRSALAATFLVAAILRLHNAHTALPLSGFDSPYHASYIGILYYEGRLPHPDEGWSTFHPPLFYATSAALWSLLPDGVEPSTVLFVLRGVSVLSGLVLAWAVYASALLLFPERRIVSASAAATALFLPTFVVYSSQIGNEMMASALAAVGFWLLLRALAEPERKGRLVACGAVLGLAALTKYTALLVLGVAVLALTARFLSPRGRTLAALAAPLVTIGTAACFLVPYFAYNLTQFGTPGIFPGASTSTTSLRIMKLQGYGRTRPVEDYFRLDTALLRDPTDRSPEATRPVWPAVFANTWYDVSGILVDASTKPSRQMARGLFAFGGVWTAFALLGLVQLVRGRSRAVVPLSGPTLVGLTALALVAFTSLSYRVATFSMLKAVYLSSAALPLSLMVGLGIEQVASGRRVALGGIGLLFTVYVALVGAAMWANGISPRRGDPALFYERAYTDAATSRVIRYFVEADPLPPRRARPQRPRRAP